MRFFDETMRSASSSAEEQWLLAGDTFPSVSVAIGGSQKVDLRSPRPALICVPRGSDIAFHRAGTGERAPRGRAQVYDAGALQSGTSLNSFSPHAGCHGAILRLADLIG